MLLTLFAKLGQTREDDQSLKKELRDYIESEDQADDGISGISLTQHKMTEVDYPNPCPPTPTDFSPEDCLHTPCQAHSNCSYPDYSCCFNGCIYTCQLTIQRAPVLDWEYDHWNHLVNKKKHEEYEVACSARNGIITPPCPEGYICQILDKGVPALGFPAEGVCENLQDFGQGGVGMFFGEAASEWSQIEPATVKEAVYLPGGCLLSTEQFSDIEEFIKGRHFTSCICSSGTVVCSVPQQGNKPNITANG